VSLPTAKKVLARNKNGEDRLAVTGLKLLVEQRGIEPLTSALRTRRSAKLSYCPTRETILTFQVSGFKLLQSTQPVLRRAFSEARRRASPIRGSARRNAGGYDSFQACESISFVSRGC
jgi:hypothetical protein